MIDSVFIVILLVSSLVGLYRGFAREVLSLIAWIIALWVAYVFAEWGSEFLEDYINRLPLRVAVAFAVLFILTMLATSGLSRFVRGLFGGQGMGGADRLIGLLFGMVRGVVIIGLIILAAIFMDMTGRPIWTDSLLVEYFIPVADALRELLPNDLQSFFDWEPDALPSIGVTDLLEN